MAAVKGKTGALGFKENGEYTPQTSGIAVIKVGEQFARVTFEDGSKQFDNGTNTKKVAVADLPKLPKLQAGTENRFYTRLTKEGDEIETIFPAEGHFNAKVIDIAKGGGDKPRPVEKVYGQGTPKESRYQVFFPIFKITKGAMKGAQGSYFLHYKFDDDGQGFACFVGNPENPKATRLMQLVDFCNKMHVVDEPITWPEDGNICPEILQRCLDNDVEVEIIVKDGFIDSLLALNNYGDDEEDEKPAKSKAADPDDEEDEPKPAKANNGKSKTKTPPASSKDEDLD